MKTKEERYAALLPAVHSLMSAEEDVSFESFEFSDAEPSLLQRFFLTHREINVAEFAKRAGINATLLRNYINGFKTPSKKRETEILEFIRSLGQEYMTLTIR